MILGYTNSKYFKSATIANNYEIIGAQLAFPRYIDYLAAQRKLIVTHQGGTIAPRTIREIDIETNKIFTVGVGNLTNSLGGATYSNIDKIIYTGTDGISAINTFRTFSRSAGVWSDGQNDILNTIAGWTTYDANCILQLRNSNHLINGKYAYVYGRYFGQTGSPSYYSSVVYCYWTGAAWTSIDLRTKLMSDAGGALGGWGNGQMVYSIAEDPITGFLFVGNRNINSPYWSSFSYLPFSASPTNIANWAASTKLCGDSGTGTSGGYAEGTGNLAKFKPFAHLTYEKRNGSNNPVFIICDPQNQVIRRLDTNNLGSLNSTTTLIAGASGVIGVINGIGSIARFNLPYSSVVVPLNGVNHAIICDYNNNKLRKLNLDTNEVKDYCGNGTEGALNN